jgi:hypothetical protein
MCALADILMGNSPSNSYFHKLMNFGRQTDLWLNLFGKPDKTPNSLDNQLAATDANNVDKLFSQVESLLKDQHTKGGLTTATKATIDRYLNKIVESKTPNDKNK